MPIGLNFTVDDLLGRKRKQRRETESAIMAERLMDDGRFTPPEVNGIISNFLKTGEFEVPTSRTKAGAKPRLLGPEDLAYNPDVPERSTINNEKINLKKKKGLFMLDDKTNQLSDESDMAEGYDDVTVVRGNKRQSGVGHTWRLDRATGDREDLGLNGRSFDSYVYWNSRTGQGSGRGAGKESPDTALAKDTLKKYQAALLKGEEIPPEFMDSVRSASEHLGIDLAEVENDPSFLDQVQNVTSTASGGAVPAAKKKYGGSAIRFESKEGKPLTKEKAQQFLQAAKGDKAKARALAKQAGFTF